MPDTPSNIISLSSAAPLSAAQTSSIPLIKSLASAGFTVFPVAAPDSPIYQYDLKSISSRSRGKTPLVHDWSILPHNPFPDPERYKNNNYGMALQSWCLVIDVDVDDNRLGLSSLSRLSEACHIDLYAHCSFAVRTGSNGLHLYFRKPAESRVRKALAVYPNLEFLSKGCFVVGPSSLSRTGKRYEIIPGKDDYASLQPVPDTLLALISKPSEEAPVPLTGLGEYADTAQHIDTARTFLRSAPGAVTGMGGDKLTVATACRMHDLGLSPETAFRLMVEEWNPRCEPPWDDDDLRGKIANAYRYAKNPLGARTAEAVFSSPSAISALDAESPLLAPGAEPNANKDIEDSAWLNRIRVAPASDGSLNLVSNDFRNACLFSQYLPEMKGVVRYNLFSNAIVMARPAPWLKHSDPHINNNFPYLTGKRWIDADTVMLKGFLDNYHFSEQWPSGWKCGVTTLNEAVLHVARENAMHPLRDQLDEAHKQWDRTPRLSQWLTRYCGVPATEYSRAVARLIFYGLVFRAFNPGHKFDYMPIFEGPQDIGKSQLCRTLALREEWFSDSVFDVSDPGRVIEATSGKFVIEWAEMVQFGMKSVNETKRFVTTRTDVSRLAYAAYVSEYPRQFLCLGTTNDEQYLMDPTGNRRYLPVKMSKKIAIKALRRDIMQLYGEAMDYFYSKRDELAFMGVPLHHHPLMIKNRAAQLQAAAEQSERMPVDERKETLAQWLDGRITREWPLDVDHVNGRVLSIPLYRVCSIIFGVPAARMTRMVQMETGRLLQALGWTKCRRRRPELDRDGPVSDSRCTMYDRPGTFLNETSFFNN